MPPERPLIATPIAAYGNNATVACPCGRIIMVRSLGSAGQGAWRCACHRRLKGHPDDGQRITHILVWDPENNESEATYCVRVDETLHQA